MMPSELRRRLLVVGAVEVPTSYPPGLAERWAHYALGGHTFEAPAVDDRLGSEDAARDAVREIRRLAGVRLDWPEWLDGPVDWCPWCGSHLVRVESDDEGWEIGCRGCGWVRQGVGPAPGSMAAWVALTAAGRLTLWSLGHPLGVVR